MTRIYLDACMVIDLVEGTQHQQLLLRRTMAGRTIFGSELVRL